VIRSAIPLSTTPQCGRLETAMTDREMLFDLVQHWRLLLTDEENTNACIIDSFNGVVAEIEGSNVLARVWRVMYDQDTLTDDNLVGYFNDVVAEVAKEINNEQ
jgi:hypothetical protein